MKMEEQVQHSPTNCQTMVSLQRHYYNGKTSEDGSKTFTLQLCHLENLVRFILYQRQRPVLIRSSWASLHFPGSFAVRLGPLAKFPPKECGPKNDVSPSKVQSNPQTCFLPLLWQPWRFLICVYKHIFQIT